MSRATITIAAVSLGFLLLGCDNNAPRPLADLPLPEVDAAVAVSASAPNLAELKRPEGVELQTILISIDGVFFTIEVPSRFIYDVPHNTFRSIVVGADEHFVLQIANDGSLDSVEQVRAELQKSGRVVIDTGKAVAGFVTHESTGKQIALLACESVFNEVHYRFKCPAAFSFHVPRTKNDYVDYTLNATDDDLRLMLYCASTLEPRGDPNRPKRAARDLQ